MEGFAQWLASSEWQKQREAGRGSAEREPNHFELVFGHAKADGQSDFRCQYAGK